jgi:O-antigen/teichoic acid export membrane protein
MTAETRSGPMVALLGIWQRNKDLLRNAGSLAGTTGLTSAFGFIYWIIAAREFSTGAVGFGSAAVSAMTLLGTIGMFGLGTMLIGELPQRTERGGLVSAALITCTLGSFALGLGFPLVAAAFGAHFPEISGTPLRLALFAVGVGLTGLTLVLDESTIGLLRGGVQLSRNLAMSAIKLAALPIAAVLLHDAFGVGILISWVVGTALSLVPAAIMLGRDGSRIFHRPDWALMRRLGKVALAHNWLNLAIATPPRIIPFLVTVVVGPSANAAFYVAWMLVNFLFMVPLSLSTVLFAIASAAPELIAEKLRFVLRLSILIGLPAMAVLAIGAHFALSIFGHSYAQLATVPLWLLILTYIPGLPNAQYIAVCRATGRVGRAAVLLTIMALCQLGAVVIGGKLGGLDGLTLGYLMVTVAWGFVTTPTVLKAAFVRSSERRAATGAMAALSETGPHPVAAGYHDRQQSGLATLLTLATVAVTEGHTIDAAAELWRTGSFPVVTKGDIHSRRQAMAETQMDLYGGAHAKQVSYRRRQQAGLDALMALATPETADAYRRKSESHD